MGFDRSDIRTMMDVYSRDNIYLGTILKVIPGESPRRPERLVAEDALQTSPMNGELMGPMPTRPLGNPGPITQSASARYATDPDARPLGKGSIVVGKWWGLAGKQTIPIDAIQTISLERVILRLQKAELDGRA